MRWRCSPSTRPSVKVLAGGTDLMADYKFAPSSHVPKVIVDISRLEELKHITMTDEGLSIGAAGHPHARSCARRSSSDLFPALSDAAHSIGAVQTRNLGTIGGNLVTACRRWTAGRRWSRSTRW